MLYSSGTTGRPKGIKRAIRNKPIDLPNPFLKILCADMCGMNSDSIYLSPAPLYHAAPLRFNMMAITVGGTSIIMEWFDAEEFLAWSRSTGSPSRSWCRPCSCAC